MATTSYEHDADGCKFIPATQRPDGTWRKPRRIKEGYVPQEEVPLYESKGRQFKTRQNSGVPVGLTPEIVAAAQKPKKNPTRMIQPIPGMLINIEKKKKKKKLAVEETTEKLAKCDISELDLSSSSSSSLPSNSANQSAQTDPAKRLKNFRKKLREIEFLEEKMKTGSLKNLDKDQKEKMTKKSDILKEIDILEKQSSE